MMFDALPAGSTTTSSFDSENSTSPLSILLVEDDINLNHQLTALLQSEHYCVSNVECGAKALTLLKMRQFDLILLDVNIPNIDGFGLLKYVRSHSRTPVIMLTAYGAEEHRIKGLRYGADDYISKPCNFEEVKLRIEAVLRRTQQLAAPTSSRYLSYQELTLDRQTYQVTVTSENHEEPLVFTPIQFKLLWTLIQHKGSVQSKPFLYQAVLEREFSPYDRALDMHLSRVRKQLSALGMAQGRIQTVHGKGYIIK
nr:response regulator transcription factor [Vibrio ichthyoenteri]